MGRKSRNKVHETWRDFSDSEEDEIEEVNWLLLDNELSNHLYKLIDDFGKECGDLRMRWVSLSDITRSLGVPKHINLKDPDIPEGLAILIYDVLKDFSEKYRKEMDDDLERLKKYPNLRDDLENSNNKSDIREKYRLRDFEIFYSIYFENMTFPVIYSKICHTICKYFVDQELPTN